MTDTPGDRPHGLALTIREGRSIRIGDDVEVWVRAARCGDARLVIRAPRELIITRPRYDDEGETPRTEGPWPE